MDALHLQRFGRAYRPSGIPLGTGSQRERQAAELRNLTRWPLYGRIGSMSHEFDAGHPIDAPDVLPAGGTSNTEWRDGRGRALTRQLEARRS